MKRILINATHNEEIRVALCKGNHMYDFDLENRTREQKKANIYKAHVTRVEPSLEAVFVEYGAERQGFLPIREIAKEYLAGNPRNENIRDLIKEGDTLIVQVEKEERGNKGAALSTYISLAGRYLVLMPNNPRGGGISRQISGKQREEMKRIVSNLQMPKGMSVIIRTAGIGKSQEDLQHDLDHLLNIWRAIGEQNRNYASPRLVHQEAGVVTRALRDYMRDDIAEIWIDSENAYNEAAYFIESVMPKQIEKLRKYTDYEPMFARFGIEKQIETAYQREVRLPSGGSIVIDQTEAMVAIDINSAKSTKGSDVAETAYHTNLEAAEEIARQLRLRDMGGLVVIDFIDMYDNKHQKDVEKNLVEATKFDRARVQFGEISKFGLMEMSRQRLRPSLEESTGYKCPRCHGTGMIRDLRSLSLSIMRQIEQIALNRRQGEVQAEVPTDVAAFLLNEKRDSLVYLEQDSGTRITILPHAHMESPDFELHYNADGFAPSSYERISDSEEQQTSDRGYEVNWQTTDNQRPEQQPTRKPRSQNKNSNTANAKDSGKNKHDNRKNDGGNRDKAVNNSTANATPRSESTPATNQQKQQATATAQPQAVAWLSNLFAPAPQAQTVDSISSQQAAEAIESIVNSGGQSLGALGQVDMSVFDQTSAQTSPDDDNSDNNIDSDGTVDAGHDNDRSNKRRHKKYDKGRDKKDRRHNKKHHKNHKSDESDTRNNHSNNKANDAYQSDKPKREPNSKRDSRGEYPRGETLTHEGNAQSTQHNGDNRKQQKQGKESKDNRRDNRDAKQYQGSPSRKATTNDDSGSQSAQQSPHNGKVQKSNNPKEVNLHVSPNQEKPNDEQKVVHLSIDQSKPTDKNKPVAKPVGKPTSKQANAQATQPVKTEQKAIKPQSQVTESAQVASVADRNDANANDANVSDRNTTKVEIEVGVDVTVEEKPTANTQASVQNATTVTAKEVQQQSTTTADVVTARADGRANNDPRVVQELLREKLAKQLANNNLQAKQVITQPTVAPSKIIGNVGEFLRATLDNAEQRIEKEGVIACFIDAIAKHHANHLQATPAEKFHDDEASVNQAIVGELAKFDFSNYGYQGLTKDYLDKFNAMTASVAQFDTAQGKTKTAPSPVGKRASNDPRGQHPDYLKTSDGGEVTTDSMEQQTNVSNAELDEFANAFNHLLDEQPASDAIIDTIKASDTQLQDAEVQEVQTVPQQLEVAEMQLEQDSDEDNKERIKTTFDRYKSMLADVSEQLSTQTGTNSMFLSTPSIPKTRSRKKKDDE